MKIKQPSLELAHSAGMTAFHNGGDPNMPPSFYDKKHAAIWKWGFSHAKATNARPLARATSEAEAPARAAPNGQVDTETKKKSHNRRAKS